MTLKYCYLATLFMLALTACSRDLDANPSHTFRVYENNGVSIAETTGGPKYEGEIFDYGLILEIREDQENPDSFMKEIVIPLYGPNGHYYFLDINSCRVVEFTPDGHYLRSIGRDGEGPGDLKYPTQSSFHGGTLNLSQSRPYRLTRFSLDGSLIEVISRELPPRSGVSPSLDIAENGNAISLFYQREQGELFRSRRACAIVTPSARDTLAQFSTEWVVEDAYVTMNIRGNTRSNPVRIHYAGSPQIRYSPYHGLIHSTGAEPYLDCYDVSGQLNKRIHLNIPLEQVSREERERVYAEYDRMIERDIEEAGGQEPPNVSITREFRNNVRFAEWKSLWRWVNIDEKGWFWLLLPTHDPVDYDVERILSYRLLNPEGEYLGNTTPPTGKMIGIFHDRIIVEKEEENTGERVWKVFRIEPVKASLKYP